MRCDIIDKNLTYLTYPIYIHPLRPYKKRRVRKYIVLTKARHLSLCWAKAQSSRHLSCD